MGIKVILENVRCKNVYILSPFERKGDEENVPKYTLQALIPKKSKLHKQVIRVQNEVVAQEWGDKISIKRLKLPLRDGDAEKDESEYEDMMFFNCSASIEWKPGICDENGNPATKEDVLKRGYSGCYFSLGLTFYPFTGDIQKGVAVGLNSIMLGEKGDRLDGKTTPQQDFKAIIEANKAKLDDDDGDDDDDDW